MNYYGRNFEKKNMEEIIYLGIFWEKGNFWKIEENYENFP